MLDLKTSPSILSLYHSVQVITFRGVVKNGYFTVRLTVRGGGVSHLGPDRKQM